MTRKRSLENVLDDLRSEGAYRLEWVNTGEGKAYKLNASLWMRRWEFDGDHRDVHLHAEGDSWLEAAEALLEAIYAP